MISLAITAALTAAPAAPQTYLASLAGLSLRPGERLDSFSIQTWGVSVEAVCHIPRGWRIRAGGSAAPDGVLEGESTQGTTRADPAELDRFALITLHGPIQAREVRDRTGGERPATFAGKAVIGGPAQEREVRIEAQNVRLTPASSCPARTIAEP
jgi:hypothetical protein